MAVPSASASVGRVGEIVLFSDGRFIAPTGAQEMTYTEAPMLAERVEAVAAHDGVAGDARAGRVLERPEQLGALLDAGRDEVLVREIEPPQAVLGDGAFQYSVQALWTAAQLSLPVTFLVLVNRQYATLKAFARLARTAGVPGLDLPGLDILRHRLAGRAPAGRSAR